MARTSLFCVPVLLLAACTAKPDVPQPSGIPVPPVATTQPQPQGNAANMQGDAEVLSGTTAGACGWGTATGDRRTGVQWLVKITDATVLLDEDMRNWPTDDLPFSGTLDGRRFSAAYSQGPDYLKYVCQFREARLVGTFSEDFSSFEAVETLYWGPPNKESRVERRWVVSRF